MVDVLVSKVPLDKWKELCSKLGLPLKRVTDIEIEGLKLCYNLALMGLKEQKGFTLAGVIETLRSLECVEAADSCLQCLQQQQPIGNGPVEQPNVDPAEQPLPRFALCSSFEPAMSLVSCGRNSTLLCEGKANVL